MTAHSTRLYLGLATTLLAACHAPAPDSEAADTDTEVVADDPCAPSTDGVGAALGGCESITLGAGAFEGSFVAEDPVEIIGDSPETTIIDAGGEGTALTLLAGGRLENLTLTHGAAESGAGLTAYGAVELINVWILDNEATDGGGGLYVDAEGQPVVLESLVVGDNTVLAPDDRDVYGGGAWIDNPGALTLRDATITGNRLTGNGGAVAGGGLAVTCGDAPTELSLEGVELRGNAVSATTGSLAVGGGFDAACTRPGTLGFLDATIAENTVQILDTTPAPTDAGAGGGGLHFSSNDGVTVRLQGTTVDGNSVEAANGVHLHGGGVWFDNVGTLALTDTALQGNELQGGASTPVSGGGIGYTCSAAGARSITGIGLTLASNTIHSEASPSAFGGGFDIACDAATLDLRQSALRENSIDVGNLVDGGGATLGGGGLRFSSNDGVTFSSDDGVTLVNPYLQEVEITGNRVAGDGDIALVGGGLLMDGPHQAMFETLTVSSNRIEGGATAAARGGGASLARTTRLDATAILFEENAISVGDGRAHGGGLDVECGTCVAAITESQFQRNSIDLTPSVPFAGGADVEVTDPGSLVGGGGLRFSSDDGVTLHIEGTQFADNSVRNLSAVSSAGTVAGGLWVNDATDLMLTDVEISGNLVSTEGYGFVAAAGAAFVRWKAPEIHWTVSTLTVEANVTRSTGFASANGGGLAFATFPGGTTEGVGTLLMDQSVIHQNEATVAAPSGASMDRRPAAEGGGMVLELATAVSARVQDTSITDNVAQATSDGQVSASGGGFRINGEQSVALDHLTATGNRAVGAAPNGYADGGAAVLQCKDTSSPTYTITNSEFQSNSAEAGTAGGSRAEVHGGAAIVHCRGGKVYLGTLFAANNQAIGRSDDVSSVSGGGLEIQAETVTLTRTDLQGNALIGEGTAVANLRGGGAGIEATQELALIDSSASGNHVTSTAQTTSRGGGLAIDETKLVILERTTVSDNSIETGAGSADGGGISAACVHCTLHMVDSLITGNLVSQTDPREGGGVLGGGGLYFSARAEIVLDPLVSEPGTLLVTSSEINDNVVQSAAGSGIAEQGAGLWIDRVIDVHISDTHLVNNALYGSSSVAMDGAGLAYTCEGSFAAPFAHTFDAINVAVSLNAIDTTAITPDYAYAHGAGIAVDCDQPLDFEIAESLLTDNTLGTSGGADTLDVRSQASTVTVSLTSAMLMGGGEGAGANGPSGVLRLEAGNATELFGDLFSTTIHSETQAIPALDIVGTYGTTSVLAGNTLIDSGSRYFASGCHETLSSAGYNYLYGYCLDATDPTSTVLPLEATPPTLGYNYPFALSSSWSIHYFEPAADGPLIDAGNPEGCAYADGALVIHDALGRDRTGRCDIGAAEFPSLAF